MAFPRYVLLLVFAGLWIAACDSSTPQREFEDRAFTTEPEGYTRTTPSGQIDSSHVDEEDWRIAPDYQFGSGVNQPPFPNPVSSGTVTFEVEVGLDVQRGGTLVVCSYDANRDRLFLLKSRRASSGPLFVFSIGTAEIPRSGLVRLFVMDANGSSCGASIGLVTYGDLLIQ